MDLHFYILWILLLMFINCNTNTIDCLNSTSCDHEDQTLNCTANEPCIINCLGHMSCKDQTLNCAANEPCTINCNSGGGKKACESTNIYHNNATNMTVNCVNYLDCTGNHIHCGAGTCTLNCGNSNVGEDNQCKDSELSCGTGPCNIYCYPNSCNDISINTAISFQCTGYCSPFPSTTQTSTIATVTPTTIQPTTISPMTVLQSTTSRSSNIISTNYSISTPINNPIITATNTHIIPSTTKVEHVIIVTDMIDNTKDEKMDFNKKSKEKKNANLWYIIGAVLFALICICCVIDLKKKYNSKSNISIKDYNDVVHTMHRQSTSLQKNELHKYDGNNTKHIKAISNSIEGDIDLTNTYNVTQHHYKSSESKLNQTFDSNKHDFSNHINLAVKCDEMILNDIHNHVETAGGLDIISDEIVNNISGKTFNDNLVNVVIGNNIMMNDIINEMETKKGDFDSQDDDEYFTSGYEMGMVNAHSYKVNINK